MKAEVHRIAVPNPFFEGRNSVYLLKCDPITLIDTGVATDRAYRALLEGLHAARISVQDIKRVILTHKHIDHIGNAWRIQREAGADVFIHEREMKSLVEVDPSGKRFQRMVAERMRSWRAPELEPDTKMPTWELEACEPTAIKDRDVLPTENYPIEVLHTPGHTMGSVCLRFGDRLFSGDHVLQQISPNVGAGDMRSSGTLDHFLTSLGEVAKLGDLEILPGHGQPFFGLRERCQELAKHHDERLEKALTAVTDTERTVFEVAERLFGELKSFHVVLGCAEASSHLEYLIAKGDVFESNGRYRKA